MGFTDTIDDDQNHVYVMPRDSIDPNVLTLLIEKVNLSIDPLWTNKRIIKSGPFKLGETQADESG